MLIHECSKLETKEQSNESSNHVEIDGAAAPEKLKVAAVTNKVIPVTKSVRIKPRDRKVTKEEIKKKITGSGKTGEERAEGNNENQV